MTATGVTNNLQGHCRVQQSCTITKVYCIKYMSLLKMVCGTDAAWLVAQTQLSN